MHRRAQGFAPPGDSADRGEMTRQRVSFTESHHRAAFEREQNARARAAFQRQTAGLLRAGRDSALLDDARRGVQALLVRACERRCCRARLHSGVDSRAVLARIGDSARAGQTSPDKWVYSGTMDGEEGVAYTTRRARKCEGLHVSCGSAAERES